MFSMIGKLVIFQVFQNAWESCFILTPYIQNFWTIQIIKSVQNQQYMIYTWHQKLREKKNCSIKNKKNDKSDLNKSYRLKS